MVRIEKIEKIKYICEICEARYETKHEAEECEARGPKPKFKVGDELQISVSNFANKKFLGKTGIVNEILYVRPKWGDKIEPHRIMYSIRLDGEDGELLVVEGILELK